MTKISEYSTKNKHKIEYPEIHSAIKPVPHSDELPVPIPPPNYEDLLEVGSNSEPENRKWSSDSDYNSDKENDPHLITQSELNDLIRDLKLTKGNSELRQWNLLAPGTLISVYRNRGEKLASFFETKDNLCYCTDINGLMNELGYYHNPDEWRLFIDSSRLSLKAVLLHNGNINPSVPVAHATGMKESYKSMETILNAIKYSEHNWSICGDLKVIGFTGMQSGFTKYCCFLCLWDSRATQQHYQKKEWPRRERYVPGESSVIHQPL